LDNELIAQASAYTYKIIGGRELKLYVTRPADTPDKRQRACVVFFHGGGWTGGAPGQFTHHSRHLAEKGLVGIQVEYRLIPADTSESPAVCIADAKSAIRWVRSHAEDLGIDPGRVIGAGGSAGGHLAAATAFIDGFDDTAENVATDAKPNALLLFNPVYNNAPEPEGFAHHRFGDSYRTYSPAHNIKAPAPPTIVFLGTQDRLIPVSTAKAFQTTMREVGVQSELVLFDGEEHGFFNYGRGNGAYERTIEHMDSFLDGLGYLDHR
jgi:acetyl esterase